jgi:hypothetical protein
MRTRTATKTNYLISEVQGKIKQAYSKWYVGTSERDNVWRRNKAEMIVFNVLDSEATRAAYKYLVNAGMRSRRPIGRNPNYLYLYRTDAPLPDGFIHDGYLS